MPPSSKEDLKTASISLITRDAQPLLDKITDWFAFA
jgi:hypothetical protein